MKFFLTAVLVVLTFSACTSTKNSQRTRVSQNVITAEEIANSSSGNAYDLVQRLRPHFLQQSMNRSGATLSGGMGPIVIINGTRVGFVDYLRTLSTNSIQEVKYLKGSEAGARYGTAANAGAFIITIR